LFKYIILLFLLSCTNKIVSDKETKATVVLFNSVKQANCSGVSVLNSSGNTILLTASHCIKKSIGDTILYSFKDEKTLYKSRIESFDILHDRATLIPNRNEAPSPLNYKSLCERCTLDRLNVHVISGLNNWEKHYGYITGKTISNGARFWEDNITIIPGWSGSPVINDQGEVVGIITSCIGSSYIDENEMINSCEPGTSYFIGLP